MCESFLSRSPATKHRPGAPRGSRRHAGRRTGRTPADWLHDLRRTAATVQVANNVDMKTTQVRLGDADAALTLKVYAQATTAQDRVAAALIDWHFADVVCLATPRALVPDAPGLDVMGPC